MIYGNDMDLLAVQKYLVRRDHTEERQLLTVSEILTITELSYKKLQEYLYMSGRGSWGVMFDCNTAAGVRNFHIYSY